MSEDEFYDSEVSAFANRQKGNQARLMDELKAQRMLLLEAACIIVNHNGFMRKPISLADYIPELGKRKTLSKEDRLHHGRMINNIKWATGKQ